MLGRAATIAHFAFAQTQRRPVQVDEPRRQPGRPATLLVRVLDLVQRGFHRRHRMFHRRFRRLVQRHRRDLRLRVVHQFADLVLFLKPAPHNLRRRRDQLPQGELVPHDLHVMLQHRRRRHEAEERRHRQRTAHEIELVFVPQPLRKRDQVDRLSFLKRRHQLRVNRDVRRHVEMLAVNRSIVSKIASRGEIIIDPSTPISASTECGSTRPASAVRERPFPFR
jgi:hypothetical protein